MVTHGAEGGELEEDLGKAGEEDAPADDVDLGGGAVEEGADADEGANPAEVEDDGGEGGDSEAVADVEHGGDDGGHADEERVREHDARERHGNVPSATGLGGELYGIGGGDAEAHEEGQHADQDAENTGEEELGAFGALGALNLGEDGNEGGTERALAKEAAEEVGDAEGDDEGALDGGGAEEVRHDNLAHQSEDAADGSHRADDTHFAEDAHGAHLREVRSGERKTENGACRREAPNLPRLRSARQARDGQSDGRVWRVCPAGLTRRTTKDHEGSRRLPGWGNRRLRRLKPIRGRLPPADCQDGKRRFRRFVQIWGVLAHAD